MTSNAHTTALYLIVTFILTRLDLTTDSGMNSDHDDI
ncbi:Protein of unknown function [Weissella confusa LBAE C39-2]|nr:Protein of unknown function [Weissella confusa LBAE C39-2]